MEDAEVEGHPVHSLAISTARPTKHLSPSPSFQRCAFTSWTRENIHKKECCFYEKGVREDICKCGYSKIEHKDEAIKPEDFTGESWHKHRHLHEVPTDAFGDISFGGLGQKTGKVKLSYLSTLINLHVYAWLFVFILAFLSVFHSQYMRVSTDTNPELLYQLLTEQWRLSPPNLLISVTGGAKNFYLKARLNNMFNRGLIKVAQTTGAWIITGGTHTGVMKHVGKAVRDYALSSSTQGQIVAIGVATWGTLHNRDALVHPEGCFPAHYELDIKARVDSPALITTTPTSCWWMMGPREIMEWRLSCVAVWRNASPGNVLETKTIYNAMLNGTPCVILEGSGRIADVIAQVAALSVTRSPSPSSTIPRPQIIEWTKKIQDIIRMPHLLTIFRISEDNHGDVDVAILQALLKASRTSESLGTESWKRQLELAIAWNRSSDLHWAMFSALVGNKPEFVSLLLENGVSLRDFLQDEETLCELYKQLPSCIFLRKLAKRVHNAHRKKAFGLRHRVRSGQGEMVSLTHVSDEVRRLLGSFTQALYLPSNMTYHFNMCLEDTSASLSKNLTSSQAPRKEDSPDAQRDPGRDIFLWAVVQNNRELAEIAWEQCTDCMSAALAASKILKTMAAEGMDADEAEDMKKLANHYEKHAIGVFNECHNWDEERAQKLLFRASPSWGRTTCLRLALEADDKSFVAQSGVQAFLTQIWCGELSVDNPVRDEVIQREAEMNEEIKTVESVTGSVLRTSTRSLDSSGLLRQKPLGRWSRLLRLYSSAQAKFYLNIVSYFAFLFLFAVVLMIDFQATPSCGGAALHLAALAARMYINDLWNILDVLSILFFIIGLAFRLTTELFYAGKILLCIDFVVFCLRLMAIFTISRTLGPKIIIVRRMMRDLFFFMFLLSIWVVAYGVAKQGILIHNDNRLDWIVRGAVYEPYLIIFGNFPTNIDYADFKLDSCTMNGSDPLKPKCPVLNENQMPAFPEWLTIIMLCIYLLFANILLLNLLIAIFNFTFQEVQDNTDRIWKFQRYELIKEYHSRPAAPPPFIILSHLYLFIRNVVLCRTPITTTEFKCELPQVEEEELLSWEAMMKDRYLLSTRQEQSQSMERRIVDTGQKVTTITERLEREEEMGSDATVQRLARLEEQVVMQSAKALQWIMESLKCQGFTAKDAQPPTLTTTEESIDMYASEKEDKCHVNARQFYYPNSKLTRFPVPEEKVPWEFSFTCYMPSYYTSEESGDHLDGSESEASNNYRNPGGRTGMRGRGALSQLGPNPNLDLVLTRWGDSERSVLDYLVVWDEKQGTLALPGGPIESADHLPVILRRTMGKKMYEIVNAKLSEGTKVFEGYVDDCRNTDNAWVEITVLNIHLDRASQTTDDINSMVVSSHGALQWREVSGKTRLSSNQRDSLRLVAELHNRKF
ncbi:hypothetical protein F7725_001889 [Dissostichus mawsoni]|uniref:Transient receptor potential cation channel subfamily M member 2 n=1 Tax=Dissostichus mawsoni TaxID=36200 RepID=A0A7J5Y125_DISMA|nr:hypothetical protein F7725_001889 [Dissostichus mawsoni]